MCCSSSAGWLPANLLLSLSSSLLGLGHLLCFDLLGVEAFHEEIVATHLRIIELFDGIVVLLLHHRTLELQGAGQLAPFDREILRDDGEPFDGGSSFGDHRMVVVRFLDGVPDLGYVLLALHGLLHGFDTLYKLRGRGKDVRACKLSRGALDLQGDQSNDELLLVAHHHDVGHGGLQLLHVGLDRNGSHVLSAGPDDQLLVSAGDLDHALRVDAALVTRVEPPLLIDGGHVLLLRPLGPAVPFRVRIGQVPHHDVAPPEAQLPLLLLGGVEQVRGPLRLGVGSVRALSQNLELDAGHRVAARPPLVSLFGGDGRRRRALGHAVHLLDVDPKASEVLESVHLDRGRAGHAELELLQTQRGLDLRGHLPRQEEATWVSRFAAEGLGLGHGEEARLGEVTEHLRESCRLGAFGLELLSDLLPHPRDAEEGGGLHRTKTVRNGGFLEVIRSCKRNLAPRWGAGSQVNWGNDIDHHASDVA
mmetsp:Transcript_33690/g.65075  ORF Transcript_33690/g.65075 Transcript_33690/m.65075 type:complete len:476 (-) Transcript_33690:716-2143(-)